jgi:hypothetical protein
MKMFCVALVLKLQVFRSLFFQALTGALQDGVSQEQRFFKKMYQVLFSNATHQAKAIVIGTSTARPPSW